MKSPLYVNFFDAINDVKVKAIMAGLAEVINTRKPDQIYCLFASPGGGVDAGITLYNFLRSLPVEIVMHNTGSIDSIANVVFLAANIRFASVHSSFLFHGVTWNFAANTSMNRGQLAETLSGLDASESKIRGLITERTKLTAEEVRSLFAQGESKAPEWALEKGIVSEIKNPMIPTDVPIVSLNLV
ncbi:MAG TPA: ATP-dependent Clp protease proteolytic subunit [Burkholderiales bacterium]|nr:ATP-dependent Clp protease proteolytic subunit [Burkholderiales bacterium]